MKKCLLLYAGFLIGLYQTAPAQKNLVVNPGFEDDLFGWNNNNAKTTPWDYKAGKNSCVIISSDTKNWIGIDQSIDIPKKAQAIEFSAWLKASNIIKGKDEWSGGIFSIEFLDKHDKKIGDGENIARLSGTEDWQQVKKTVTLPPGAVSFRILLAMGYASGSMLIDDITAVVKT